MKVIEGFHINKIKFGTKKGQEYINSSKKYFWKIPERLNGQIDNGDIVLVHTRKYNRDIKAKVLVSDILENNDGALRSVINIVEKCNGSK